MYYKFLNFLRPNLRPDLKPDLMSRSKVIKIYFKIKMSLLEQFLNEAPSQLNQFFI
jgi:hypothetical protein